MIIVTGATGQLGSRITQQLLQRTAAENVGVSVRDAGRAAHLVTQGVRVRAADFTDPSSLDHALTGAHTVVIVSASIRDPDEAVAANRAAVDAAVRAGAQRVLYTSHQAASGDSLFSPAVVHAANERYLLDAGVPVTLLRNGFYASTLGHYLGQVHDRGRIVVPADGPVSWTGHDDLAEVAAVLALDHAGMDGVTPPLTASAALDFAAVAQIAGEIVGRPVAHVVVDDDEWKRTAVSNGMPAAAAEFTLGIFRAARAGEFAVTDPAMGHLIGHDAAPARVAIERALEKSLPQ